MPTIGEVIRIDGYDLTARADVVFGGGPPDTQEVILLHDHGSHYILAHRDPDSQIATVINTWRYGDGEVQLDMAWTLAMQTLIRWALLH